MRFLSFHDRSRVFNNALLLFASFVFANNASLAQVSQNAVEIVVAFPTIPVKINGASVRVYELRVFNRSDDSIRLNSLAIIDTRNNEIRAHFNEADLGSRCSATPSSNKTSAGTLSPKDSTLIYLEYGLDASVVSSSLSHRIIYSIIRNGRLTADSLTGAAIHPSASSAIVLSSPFKEGIWAAVHDPSWVRGHRRVHYTVDSRTRIPGRFAIDFIRLDEQGKYTGTNEDSIQKWYGYGQEVLAVCDGIVGDIRNDFPESPTMSAHLEQKGENASGNFISINAGNNNWVFYEHLKPGSVIVRPGQRVRKGQVIGSLGFTGQTTGPHLHLHVANNNSALGAEGLPYVFEQYTSLGTYTSLEKFGKEKWQPLKQNSRRLRIKEHPQSNEVIRFRKTLKSF